MADTIGHGRVLRIALPIVLSNATVPLLGAVDTGVVGQMGQAAPIGAVGLGAVVLATFYWIFGFLRMGTSGLAAQAHGAGHLAERDATLIRALLIGLGAGLVFIAGQALLFWLAFRVAPASAEVEAMARDYLTLRIWGAPATIALYAVTGWLIALERTRGVLLLQLWMNGLNIGLDLWFVLGLGWGVPGVAIATLIAEWSGLALGLWLCRDGLRRLPRGRLFDAPAWRRLVGVNGDIMLRSVLLQGAFTTFIFLGARQGDVTLAANQVLMQFLEITAYALDGIAVAAETLVGQAVGARAAGDLRRTIRIVFHWGCIGAGLLALGFALAGPVIIDVMTTAPEVRIAARDYLWWMVAAPLLGVTSWLWDGIYIGATATREMRNLMILCVSAYAALLAMLVPAFGNHGLWASMMGLYVLRGLTQTLRWPGIAQRLTT